MRGSKPGERRGGRKVGTKNKRTAACEHARGLAAQKIEEILGETAFSGDAHALLMAVYKDPAQPTSVRLDAAKAAIGYEKGRCGSSEKSPRESISLADLVLSSYRPGDAFAPKQDVM